MWTTRQGRLAIVFAVLAGTAWWLLRSLIEEPVAHVRDRAPNHVVTELRAVETDADGRPERHLVADQLRQYAAEDLAELDRPHLTLFDRQDGPPWEVRSQQGFLLSNGQEVVLRDQVQIDRAGAGSTRSFRLQTAELRLWPKREYAQGDRPVQLDSDRDRLTAAGVRLWYAHPARAEFPGRAHILVAPAATPVAAPGTPPTTPSTMPSTTPSTTP